MRPIGIIVLKRPLCGHHVPADEVREVARQRAQLLEDFLVELVDRDVRSDLGQLLTLRGLGLLVGPAVPGAGPRCWLLLTAVPGERAGVPLTALPA
ncbi:hypothetical protein ABZ897_17275 [Nonomuraea sp. NPDC046802]|uniref:hypothetical protein n=1 Tax=Nonomuraea sp. NPDC046802 TaxID=3154919 RepID=UPI0033ECE392